MGIKFKNRFVCPTPLWLRGRLNNFNRLYAYPVIPEPLFNSEFQILDSGAYGLSKFKGKMSPEYIDKLGEHYLKYKTDKNIFCVAPDKGGDYKTTIKQLEYYLSKFEYNVSPVLQFSGHDFNWIELKYQIEYYKDNLPNIEFIFFAKRGAYSFELKEVEIVKKIDYIFEKLNCNWIHFFAAGWGKNEVKEFSKFSKNISIDTINYYQSAMVFNKNLSDWGWGCSDKIKNALYNVELANKLML